MLQVGAGSVPDDVYMTGGIQTKPLEGKRSFVWQLAQSARVVETLFVERVW
jgi:hypothetical protein